MRFVVVDEYQDTNHVQERSIERLSRFGANLCVVGDDDQTIYQWRGSAVSNILTFVGRREGVQRVTLDDNFRSSQGSSTLGQAVAERTSPSGLTRRWSPPATSTSTAATCSRSPSATPDEEARWICDRIEALRGMPFLDEAGGEPRGLTWSDFAVLFRSVSMDAGPLVEEMKRREIPYVIKGLTRLFDAPEVQACVTSFQFIMDELDADDASTHGSKPTSG